MIGTLVGAMILLLYRETKTFFLGAVKVEALFFQVFATPAPGRAGLILPAQYLFSTAMAFVSAWVCMELPRFFGRIAFLAGAVFLTLLLSPALWLCGVLFEPFSGAGAILLSGVCGMILGSTETGRRRHTLQHYFVGRLSAEKFARLVGTKGPLDISGKRELTVLTCRILNYPDLSAQMDPHDLEQLSSKFLQATAEFLVARGAYLDACNAEGVRVFFGMPDEEPDHAVTGCQVALELRQRLVNLEQEMQGRWHRHPAFGVALATGPMSIGLIGFREFQFFSAVGEALDFSRRLCSINLVYGSHVLVNSRTFHLAVEKMEMRPMEMVYAPRLHQVSEVYELMAEKGGLNDEEVKARDAFWQGVVSLRKGAYSDAVRQLQTAKLDGREDQPLKYFLERAEAGLRDDGSPSEPKTATRHVRVLTAN